MLDSRRSAPRAVRFGTSEPDLCPGQPRRARVRAPFHKQSFCILIRLAERSRGPVTRDERHQQRWRAATFVDVLHCVFDAPSRDALADWSGRMNVTFDRIVRVEVEGQGGILRDL